MTTPGKLVRDRIPEIVAARGHRATTRRLEPSERPGGVAVSRDELTRCHVPRAPGSTRVTVRVRALGALPSSGVVG